jgi:hypothetical protein
MNRRPVPFDIGPVHFIGIGGIGMSGIAEIMLRIGYEVQGSDAKASANTERLEKLGARIFIGHDPAHVEGAYAIVYSTAVKADNPEMAAARERRLPLVRRAEMLAELMRLQFSVAVGGTHGKTTTTSMIACLLDAGGLDPTVVNGGIINAYGTNAKVGAGDWIVVEADESDGTFLKLRSTVAVVTNIDPEHLDHYGDFDAVKRAFRDFVENIPFYGFAAVCTDHPEVQAMASRVENRRLVAYGVNPQAEVRAEKIAMGPDGARFDVVLAPIEGEPVRLEGMHLPMAGHHNVMNALAAIAVARSGDRRLRSSPCGDRLGAHRRPGGHRRRTGDRGGPAAPLLPAERPVRRVLPVLQRRRHGDRRRRLCGRRGAAAGRRQGRPGGGAAPLRAPPGAAARRPAGACRPCPPGKPAGRRGRAAGGRRHHQLVLRLAGRARGVGAGRGMSGKAFVPGLRA